MGMFVADVRSLLISALILYTNVLFLVYVVLQCLHFLCFLLVILLSEMVPKGSAKLPSSGAKHKKALLSLVGKIHA